MALVLEADWLSLVDAALVILRLSLAAWSAIDIYRILQIDAHNLL